MQLGNHARMLRKLTEIPGEPGVMVGCHPAKSGDTNDYAAGDIYHAVVDGILIQEA